MTIAEALNILANAAAYAEHGLIAPTFIEEKGMLVVSFSIRKSPYFGMNSFTSMEQLNAYITGRVAAVRDQQQVDYEQAEAAKAEAAKAAAAAAPVVTPVVTPVTTESAETPA